MSDDKIYEQFEISGSPDYNKSDKLKIIKERKKKIIKNKIKKVLTTISPFLFFFFIYKNFKSLFKEIKRL
jgi:hypothetical protein